MIKCPKHIRFYLLGFFASLTSVHYSQDKNIKTDSTEVAIKPFKDHIKDRYQDSEFNYDINDTGGVNLIQGLFRKFFRWLGDVFGIDIDFVDYQTLEIIIYSLLGLGSLYLFLKFMLQSPIGSVFKTEEHDIEGFSYVEENINTVNFDDLITSALKQNNYRLATRYMYLKSLKILSKKGIIDWHYDKTNSDYINEITNETTRNRFKRISYIYDYVWYGEFEIDENQFKRNQTDFNTLNTNANG
ncbi:hypothetical protein [Hanstruepera marina]|uniref:hypothetical protein n=1 Tax=Hanstruepera marina TaxID=2873265 RepID=UPI001CA75042|nr:hypothetical protein [Hanstruepera marina]